jgi:outer membrane protein assembly factor BamE
MNAIQFEMFRRKLPLLLVLLLAAGCSYEGGIKLPGVHRIDIQQGNVITQDLLDRLRPGMDKNQVQFIMGTPAIVDPFHTEQWEYIFTLSEEGETRRQRHVRIHFENDRLAFIDGDVITTDRTRGEAMRASRTVDVPITEARNRGIFRRMIDALPFVGDDDARARAPEPPPAAESDNTAEESE